MGDIESTSHKCLYALFTRHFNSKWTEIMCRASQGTKLTALLFLAVINYVLVDFDECFEYVNDLSALLKFSWINSKQYPSSNVN